VLAIKLDTILFLRLAVNSEGFGIGRAKGVCLPARAGAGVGGDRAQRGLITAPKRGVEDVLQLANGAHHGCWTFLIGRGG